MLENAPEEKEWDAITVLRVGEAVVLVALVVIVLAALKLGGLI